MQTQTISSWTNAEAYGQHIFKIADKNLEYYNQINESRDVAKVLKALSDYYYGLLSLKNACSFFIRKNSIQNKIIVELFDKIKAISLGKELLQCPLKWEEIYEVRDLVFKINEEIFYTLGESNLLTPAHIKKTYDDNYEVIDAESI